MKQNNENLLSTYPDIINVRDVQEILHIGRVGVYKLIQNQEIMGFKIGNTYKIPKASLIEFINQKSN